MRNKFLLTLVITCLSLTTLHAQYTLENAFPDLTFSLPVFLTNAADSSDRIFVVEQSGRIKVFQNSSSVQSSKIFLDISDEVASGGERGLLGLAFHPDYKNNGIFFVDYTIPNPLRTRISKFQVSSSPDSAIKNSEVVLLTINQPYTNHNGGWIGFGSDGYLYISVGDGGSGGDPDTNAQNITRLLGKILRIDVDHQDEGLQYAIPADNPFVDSTGNVKKEIYAWGLRNPWRQSFDPETGWLWCADVGQGSWEEIDIIQNGRNYGWRCYEGNHEYNTGGCNYPEYTFPIWEYDHNSGRCSITGGYVYHGNNVPDLTGKYIYADYCSGTIWALSYDGSNPATNKTLLTAPSSVVSFGVDENQELYIITRSSDEILKFKPPDILSAPINFTATATGTNEVSLNWEDNNTQEQGFKIERKNGSNGIYKLIDSVEQNITNYSDQSVQENTLYYYRVYAYLDQVVSAYSNEDSAQTPNVTGVKNSFVPFTYNLEQNFPNPFNPTTKIMYQIANRGFVSLRVYNILGNKVATLVNEEKPAGIYIVEFDASSLPSGIYFYHLQTGSFISTKKLILMK
ncbi:PQQ-dependent sugar dehydrogenase [bacterium BMS3Abin03]|nr:PQQ-dependent sugar dehydrogenase [bacterium BMS3Abin03]